MAKKKNQVTFPDDVYRSNEFLESCDRLGIVVPPEFYAEARRGLNYDSTRMFRPSAAARKGKASVEEA